MNRSMWNYLWGIIGMNEQLQKRFESYLEGLETAARRAGDFTASEVPLAIQEWLRWQFWDAASAAAMYGFLTCVLLALAGWLVRLSYKNGKVNPFVAEGCAVGSLLTTALGLLFLVLSYGNIKEAIKITIAPRVVIVEKIATLLPKR